MCKSISGRWVRPYSRHRAQWCGRCVFLTTHNMGMADPRSCTKTCLLSVVTAPIRRMWWRSTKPPERLAGRPRGGNRRRECLPDSSAASTRFVVLSALHPAAHPVLAAFRLARPACPDSVAHRLDEPGVQRAALDGRRVLGLRLQLLREPERDPARFAASGAELHQLLRA